MYCWGKTEQGALGLGGIEESSLYEPTWNKYMANNSIKTVACGQDHTIFLLNNGSLFSCGNNEHGQLGHENGNMRPAQISKVNFCDVLDVKCGLYHTVMITATSCVYAWGDNTYGQLSFADSKYERCSRLVELPLDPPECKVVQVACGAHHTNVLLNDGRVFSWGRNDCGQLGHSKGSDVVSTPKVVSSIEAVPIKRITAGGWHNFALSISGRAFGWGNNSCGQLSVPTGIKNSFIPVQFSLNNIKIKHIECGETHTVALVEDGSVFTCGSNRHGQLGRHTIEETTPQPGAIQELMGSEVSQIACGRYHTIVLLKTSGRIFSFGLNSNGQLGCTVATAKAAPPFVVKGEWLPHNTLDVFRHGGSPIACGNVVKRVFAGGNQSFATVFIPSEIQTSMIQPLVMPFDHGTILSTQCPLFLNFEALKQMLDVALLNNTCESTANILTMFFSSPSCINGSFLRNDHRTVNNFIGVDLEQIKMAYDLVRTRLSHIKYDEPLKKALFNDLLLRMPHPSPSYECLRAYCFLLGHPTTRQYPTCNEILVPFIKSFLKIKPHEMDAIGDWLFQRPNEVILDWIEIFRKPIEEIIRLRNRNDNSKRYIVYLTDDETWSLQEGLKILRWIYYSNMKRNEPISFKCFYVDNVADFTDLWEDYKAFVEKKLDRVVFSRYHFILNAAAKAEILKGDTDFRKMNARAHAHASFVMNAFMRPPSHNQQFSNPNFCEILVRRETILQDSLTQLLSRKNHEELRKPLMVKFVGEDGVDWGGVTKEFFMLLMKEVLNPLYGLFYEEEESRLIWFREQPSDIEDADRQQFFMVGMLCGLAIYNGVNLDLPFPLIVYKKMLGETGINKPTVKDLRTLKPSVGKHLQDMLEVTNDDVFKKLYPGITFEITKVFFGTPKTISLIPDGANVYVNTTNCHKYVQNYVEYELINSIKEQFDAFLSGFERVFNTKSEIYKLLHPEELMSFVEGSITYDFQEMMKHTEYLNGYNGGHPSIRHFWNVVMDFAIEAKKKLLIFWTSSDRIPITGFKNMKLRIQRMDGGHNYSKLPVAHTCANVLDLPPYPTQELMRDKLLKAIYFTSGFGIV